MDMNKPIIHDLDSIENEVKTKSNLSSLPMNFKVLLLLVGVLTAVTVCAAVVAVCVTVGTSQLLLGTHQHPNSNVEQQGDPHIDMAEREELLRQV